MLNTKNLSVIYPDGTVAVDRLTMHIKKGESTALIGANGSGKTSLIMSLVGVIPSQGEVIIDNITLSKKTLNQIRAKTGVIFQNPDDQLFMPSVYDDIAFGPRNFGIDETETQRRIEQYLSMLNIEHLREKTTTKLSGGEKRMAALASILVMEPQFMLFDEPTAFLDPKARRALINTLNSLAQTKLIATHDLSFAVQTCSRAVLIKDGRIFADGKTKDMLYNSELMESCGVEAISVF